MTIKEFLKASASKLGVVDPDEDLTANQYAVILKAYNSLVNEWFTRKILSYVETSGDFTMVAGTAQYSCGTAGTAVSTYFAKLLFCIVRDSNNLDYEVQVVSQPRFEAIHNKLLSGRPRKVWYGATFEPGYLSFYPVPDAAYTCYIKFLYAPGEVSDTSVSFPFPNQYLRPLMYQLAIDIAPDFNTTPSPVFYNDAERSLRMLESLNAGNQYDKSNFDVGLPGVWPKSTYSIEEG